MRKKDFPRQFLAVEEHRDKHGEHDHDGHLHDQVNKRVDNRFIKQRIREHPRVVRPPIPLQIRPRPRFLR